MNEENSFKNEQASTQSIDVSSSISTFPRPEFSPYHDSIPEIFSSEYNHFYHDLIFKEDTLPIREKKSNKNKTTENDK